MRTGDGWLADSIRIAVLATAVLHAGSALDAFPTVGTFSQPNWLLVDLAPPDTAFAVLKTVPMYNSPPYSYIIDGPGCVRASDSSTYVNTLDFTDDIDSLLDTRSEASAEMTVLDLTNLWPPASGASPTMTASVQGDAFPGVPVPSLVHYPRRR